MASPRRKEAAPRARCRNTWPLKSSRMARELRLSLVSCAVGLCTATTTASDMSFNLINPATGRGMSAVGSRKLVQIASGLLLGLGKVVIGSVRWRSEIEHAIVPTSTDKDAAQNQPAYAHALEFEPGLDRAPAMSEPSTSISERDFSKWPSLSAVLANVEPEMRPDAHQKVTMRLSKGLLVARAEDSFLAERAGTKIVLPERSIVSIAVWKRMKLTDYRTQDSLWEYNTVIDPVGRRSNGGGARYEHFGVRLEPIGVAKMLLDAMPKAPRPRARLPRPARAVTKPIEQGNLPLDMPPQEEPPPLSPVALKLWYEACSAAYAKSEQSLGHA